MKHIFRKITFAVAGLSALFIMSSCDTDIEPVDINEPGIENQNDALYESYLQNLRAYKASNHKVIFASFDNSQKQPYSQGQQLNAVPDSIDYLLLNSPADVTPEEMYKMNELREKKGTKVLYRISFEDIKAVYDANVAAFQAVPENAGKAYPVSFNNYLVDSVTVALDNCTKYNFDGVVMAYNGKFKLYMSEVERETFISYENDFIGIAIDWAQRNADRTLIFQGKPQNVINQEIFKLAKYIIIPCTDETSASGLTFNVSSAVKEGVPVSKLLPSVQLYSTDATDTKTGYWSNGTPAALGAAQWAATEHESYDIAGLCMENINADYYHSDFTYPTVRKAISILNPTVKK